MNRKRNEGRQQLEEKMKTIISIVMIGLAIAGCSPVNKETTPKASALVTPATTKVPATENSGSSSKPDFSKTKGPPAILLGPGKVNPPSFMIRIPTPALPEGWVEFNSTMLHIAVNYPSNWSVKEQANEVRFTSPSGAVILIQAYTPNGANTGSQPCTTLITTYGLTANLCGGEGMYSAEFNLQLEDGSSEALMISTTSDDALETYKEMIDSLHPNP
jgi:hypothetical protein